MSVLIKGGRVITATDDYFADVFIEGEKVTQIGKDLAVKADQTIDATGKLVIPGGIDSHTHFDMPFGGTISADDFESGTMAAAHGGTTMIVDFAIQTKGESTLKGLDTWHAKAEGKATIDYGFHMIITDMADERLHGDGPARRRGRHLATSSSWRTRACSTSTTARCTAPSAGPARTARASACTPRTAS